MTIEITVEELNELDNVSLDELVALALAPK